MADTNSAVLSGVLTFTAQRALLENLRANLVFANKAFAAEGRFIPGADVIKFASVDDLAIADTPLTEGTAPAATALVVNSTNLTADQYGQRVNLTDLAKVYSPFDLPNVASERLSRAATETVDQIVRDTAALGGTAFIVGAGNTARADIAAGDVVTAAELSTLRATMFKNKVPMLPGGGYLLYVSPEVGQDIRTDSTSTNKFIEVHKYTESGRQILMKGEIGMLAGFRIVEVVNAPTAASTTTVHLSLALGALPGWGWGDLQTMRAYHVAPGGHGDELSQNESLGWKVSFGTAVLKNDRYYRMESGATAL